MQQEEQQQAQKNREEYRSVYLSALSEKINATKRRMIEDGLRLTVDELRFGGVLDENAMDLTKNMASCEVLGEEYYERLKNIRSLIRRIDKRMKDHSYTYLKDEKWEEIDEETGEKHVYVSTITIPDLIEDPEEGTSGRLVLANTPEYFLDYLYGKTDDLKAKLVIIKSEEEAAKIGEASETDLGEVDLL